MITIRKATASDAPEIAPIMALAMLDLIYGFIGKENQDEAIAFMKLLIAKEDNQYSFKNIWIASEEAKIIGQICLYPGDQLQRLRAPVLDILRENYNQNIQVEDETAGGEIYIDTLSVSEADQGKGVGKRLLQHVIELHIRQNKEKIGLLVDKDNPRAKQLYLKTGFKSVGSKSFMNHDMDHLQMS